MVSNLKKSGAVLSVAMLASMGAAGVANAAPVVADSAIQAESAAQAVGVQKEAAAKQVEGTFSYDQAVTTSNASITDVFSKAAAVMCRSMPEYTVANAKAIRVGGPAGQSFSATIDQMGGQQNDGSIVIACACSANGAGGGAIANAQASGVMLETIMAFAGAR